MIGNSLSTARIYIHRIGLIVLCAALCVVSTQRPAAANLDYVPIDVDQHATVAYSYFQIDEDAYPDASLNFESFSRHVEIIKNEEFNVVSLQDLDEDKSRKKRNASPNIAITFDTGHRSILDQAVPLLLKEKIPFAIFITPREIDQGLPYLIQWSELKKLARNPLVTIGIHNAEYKNISSYNDRSALEQSILSAISRYREVFGTSPLYYAYPYGDHDSNIAKLLRAQGIKHAFGLHSGVIYKESAPYNLPRFTMTDNYGSGQRFVDTAYNLPFPTFDPIPENTVLSTTPDSLSFSIPKAIQGSVSSLQCFHSGLGRIETEVIGEERVHIPLGELGELSGRVRVNCTINAGYDEDAERQRWRWHGILLRVNE